MQTYRKKQTIETRALKAANKRDIPIAPIVYGIVFLVSIGMCISCIVTLLLK